ncbi:MAG TPA: cupin domain-containing protein [Candidatus Tumulicola sp.]|jgi:quercetin dioxygenase-like cupin family protein
MKLSSGVLLGAILSAGLVAAASAGPAAVTLSPSAMHWVAGTGVNKGTSLAILTGNPTKTGTSVIRVKMPDGYVNKPHYHSHPEYITVIQGTVLFGTGDTVDKSKAKAYPTGSFIAVPTGLHHWSVTQGETIEQIGGLGPLTNIPIK